MKLKAQSSKLKRNSKVQAPSHWARHGFLLRLVFGISLELCALNFELRASELRAGAAQVVITPPTGIGLAGYYFDRGADGTNDDLYAKALVLDDGKTRVALVTLDLISTTRPMVEATRREIEKTTGIPGSNVMISATHAHTAPVLAGRGVVEDPSGSGSPLSKIYSASLPALIAESVQRAAGKIQSARLTAAVALEPNLSFNRRFHLRDGSVGWNSGKGNTNIIRPAGPIDPEVRVLSLDAPRKDGATQPLAAYVNFALHTDTVGGSKFSSDYPGVLARRLAEVKGTEIVTLFANGACGNLNHINVNWPDPQKGPAEANRIGTVLAAAVFKAWMQAVPVTNTALRVSTEIVKLPLPELKPGDAARARETVLRLGMKYNKGFMEKVDAYKILDVAAREGRPHEVEVQVFTLGHEVAWVALPGEVFVELGLAIKQSSPFRHTFITELANGSIGYVPNQPAYLEGNYEVISARCAAGSGELLVDSAVRQLRTQFAAARRETGQ